MLNNYSLAILVLEETVRCIAVSYDPNDTIYVPGGKKPKPKTVSFKTLDQDLKPGDLVVVPTDTRHGFTVGKVEEVDLAVDFSSPEQMRWIATKFDVDEYEQILKREEELVGKVRNSNVNTARRQMQQALFEADPELAALKGTIQGGAPLPPPAAPPSYTGDEPAHRGGSQPRRRSDTGFDEDLF